MFQTYKTFCFIHHVRYPGFLFRVSCKNIYHVQFEFHQSTFSLCHPYISVIHAYIFCYPNLYVLISTPIFSVIPTYIFCYPNLYVLLSTPIFSVTTPIFSVTTPIFSVTYTYIFCYPHQYLVFAATHLLQCIG